MLGMGQEMPMDGRVNLQVILGKAFSGLPCACGYSKTPQRFKMVEGDF